MQSRAMHIVAVVVVVVHGIIYWRRVHEWVVFVVVVVVVNVEDGVRNYRVWLALRRVRR